MTYPDQNSAIDPDNEIFRYQSCDFIMKYVENGSKVLDVGAGDGAVALPVADLCKSHVTCFDQQPDRLQQISNLGKGLPIQTIVGDCHDLPFKEDSFDVVYSRMLLSHLPRWRDALSEQVRVCKPGGVVIAHHRSKGIVDVLNDYFPESRVRDAVLKQRMKTTRSCATPDDFNELAEKLGCDVIETAPIGLFLANSAFFETAFERGPAHEAFRKDYHKHLLKPDVRSFVDWFERTVTPKLAPALTEMFFTVLRTPQESR